MYDQYLLQTNQRYYTNFEHAYNMCNRILLDVVRVSLCSKVEALPCFPIRWTAYGIYLESAESTLNHQNIVQFVNQITLPHLNLVAIDVLDLVEQEIRASTDLGLRLKCTKQDSNEKKKEADRQKWIPPAALLLEAIHKRISMDRDIEHKKEDARRKKDIEDAKAELEATSVNLKKAQEEFVSAEKALKMFNSGIIEPKEDVEKPKAPATTKKGTAAAKVEKEKSTATNSGKPKAAKDILKPEENNVLEDDTKQKLVTSLTEAKLRYQEMEKKAKMAVSCLKKKESSRLERYSLVQVYILLGLPNNPSFIASLGDGDKKIMCAILNLKASHIHEEIKISEQMSSKEGKSGNGENTLSKSLAVELKALARTSGINDPSRQIAIIDVEYENVISDEMKGLQEEKDTVGNEKKKGKPKIKDVEGTLPYKSIAKALAEALQNFSLALIAYKNMMRKIQFTKVPHAVGFEDIDTTYYKQLLSEVPTNFLNVPVILHCVLEQVALNSVADTELKENCLKGEEKNVKNYLEKKFLNFGRNSPGSAKDSQDKDMSKETCSRHSSSGSDVSAEHVFLLEKRIELLGSRENVHILHDFDLIEKEAIIFSSSQVLSLPSGTVIDATEVSKHMARLLPFPGHQRQGMPKVALLSQEERGTLVSKILNDGRYSLSAVQLHQKLKKLKDALFMAENSNVLLEALQLQNFLQSVRKSQFMELYPDCLATEAYVKAKLTRGFERVIYDEMEDCIVSLLYAADGMYEWKYSIPFQIPFADFVDKHLDLESFTVAPRAYGISENKSQLYEKRFFYLSEDGSLFSFGLPSISESVKEPQGTLHMDGNTFVLRPSKSNNMSNMELTACFGDGLIACFFPGGNGLINIQLTTPEGNTIEMNYDGIVHMLDTYANKDSEMNFDQLKIVNDKRTTEENNTLHYEDSFLCSTKAEEDSDSWRCILPSGSLLCGRKSGELVAMFPNGNVSHYKKLKSQSFQWTTTNSSGYQVIQESRDTRHLNQNDILQNVEVNMDEVQKTGPKSSKDQKQTKKDNSGSLPLPKGTPGKKNKVAAEPNLGSTNSQKSESPSISAADPPENTTEKDFPKLISDDPSKPLLYMLPKKRMVCMKDSLTNCCIESREDLVTVVRFPEGEQIALHSDGTHIYTKSFRSESSASIMNTSTPADNSGECSSDVEKKEALIDQVINENELLEKKENSENDYYATNAPNMSNSVIMSTDPVTSHVNWQIECEKYPTVWSDGDNIIVSVTANKNYYILSFCKSSRRLHLLLPNGHCMHTSGNSVFLNCTHKMSKFSKSTSAAKEVEELEAWEENHLAKETVIKQLQNPNAKGLYKFDLEEGSISFQDSAGDGFYASPDAYVQTQSDTHDSQFRYEQFNHVNQEPQDTLKTFDPQIRGPLTKCFVLYEDGHGYELYGSDVFDIQLQNFQNEGHSMHSCQEYKSTLHKALLHTLIKQCDAFPQNVYSYSQSGEQTTLSAYQQSPSNNITENNLKDVLNHCPHMKKPLPYYCRLPQVTLQSQPSKRSNKQTNSIITYRHIREYPSDYVDTNEMDQYLADLSNEQFKWSTV